MSSEYALPASPSSRSRKNSFESPLLPVRLVYNQLECTWLVPSELFSFIGSLKDAFISATRIGVEKGRDAYGPTEFLSHEELAAAFLDFLLQQWRSTQPVQDQTKHLLEIVLQQFETNYIGDGDIHSLVAKIPGSHSQRLEILRTYYEAHKLLGWSPTRRESSLLRAVDEGKAVLYAVFGGQGNTEDYLSELEEIYLTYGHLVSDMITANSQVLYELHRTFRLEGIYSKGLDVLRWLQQPHERPESEYLLSAPISFPVIGLVQIVQYALTCRLLDMKPGDFRNRFSGLSGHSQGLIIALAISQSDSWESFTSASRITLHVLFQIGLRSQQGFPQSMPPPSIVDKSVARGEGIPTPMVSVRGLPIDILERQIHHINIHLPQAKKVSVGLFNGPQNAVVNGPPTSLCGLNDQLGYLKAPSGLDQTRIPFSQRKLDFTNAFLPISAPFHSHYLQTAYNRVLEGVCDSSVSSDSLHVPVYATLEGRDLSADQKADILPTAIRMVMCQPVHWEAATLFPNATHILDFGPGRDVGIGKITKQNKEGRGVRVIFATKIGGHGDNETHKEDLLGCDREVTYATNWLRDHGPRLIRSHDNQILIDTKFTRLMRLPHLMVAGMTPCTVPTDFVIATMNAGYHIELAGGGYYDPKTLENAIREVGRSVTPGRTVTLNALYANPRGLAWQIPLVKRLRSLGVPIDGLTIGAGVPSLDVGNDYIESLGLRYIAFKPGSMSAILRVIEIAKANPRFPIMLQWTGGRGGGHHSYEDFHQPIIQTYGRIRECSNIILVAGSGFGGADDTYPYLSGCWTLERKLHSAPMPFDGILFGSRIMVAKEAHSSQAVKQAIVNAQGVDDSKWEQSYSDPIGGVMTVSSEMGEPIHKLATRGVKLWADLDDKIFRLDRAKRVDELQRQRQEIIKKLNSDYQKPWFGRNWEADSLDLEDMTYAEVLTRLIELLYVVHQSRWIDISYKKLVDAFIRRAQERFISDEGTEDRGEGLEIDSPTTATQALIDTYPACHQQTLTLEDAQYFLHLCKTKGQKPVPFVPALDDDFEYWFKKDSLWQSEDLDAVVDQDFERTCILQGPVAVQHSQIVDEPVQHILDSISQAHIQKLKCDLYEDDTEIPNIEYLADGPQIPESNLTKLKPFRIASEPGTCLYRLSRKLATELPDLDAWFKMLAGDCPSWRYALFASKTVVQGQEIVENPLRRMLTPEWNYEVEITQEDDFGYTLIKLRERTDLDHIPNDLLDIRATSDQDVLVTLYKHENAACRVLSLDLMFSYHPEAAFAPIREVLSGRRDRIRAFYYRLWFGDEEKLPDASPEDYKDDETVVVSHRAAASFSDLIWNSSNGLLSNSENIGDSMLMDFAFVVCFKAILKPLFLRGVDGDFLRLVHLGNGFKRIPDTEPLRVGETLLVESSIHTLSISEAGKTVGVECTVKRKGEPILEITSDFLFRGDHKDFDRGFKLETMEPIRIDLRNSGDVSRLQAREWFSPIANIEELIGKPLIFHISSLIFLKTDNAHATIRVKGKTLYQIGGTYVKMADIDYESTSIYQNPVTDYLEKYGCPVEPRREFDNHITLSDTTVPLGCEAPASNAPYASVSGDFNPIHVSSIFSRLGGLFRTVTHGMFSSAVARLSLEKYVAQDDATRMRSFTCSFVGLIVPGDRVEFDFWHTGMIAGRKIVKFEARKNGNDRVLVGEAEIEQEETAYIFTGQGSQYPRMGMEVYDQNGIARDIWDRAESYFMHNYGKSPYLAESLIPMRYMAESTKGFSILNIVRHNPKEHTVFFGGRQGRAIRKNYTSMSIERLDDDGRLIPTPIFEDIDEASDSYTFHSPEGLLYLTQFAQPALMVLAQANYEILASKGIIQENSCFAGHSLGEYAAFSTFGNLLGLEDLLRIVFYRGLAMQFSVKRDCSGQSDYAMCALNPRKIATSFDEAALHVLVEVIAKESGSFLEIVNYNIRDQQYVCTGDLLALDILISVTNRLGGSCPFPFAADDSQLQDMVSACARESRMKPRPIALTRGVAAIPLHGVDVPFHSTLLRPGIRSFKSLLYQSIRKEKVDPQKLVGKWIPNLIGKPFEATKEYAKAIYEVTGSQEICRFFVDCSESEVSHKSYS